MRDAEISEERGADYLDKLAAAKYVPARTGRQEGGAGRRYGFIGVPELLRRPVPRWLVPGVIPERGLVVMYGASGSGKTFAVLDLSAAIVRGIPWAGRRTRRGVVCYVAAEGQLRDRVEAYLHRHGQQENALAGLRILDSSVNLLNSAADETALVDALREVSGQVGPVALVVIDTLNRVMPGGDENSAEDMGRIVAAAKRIEQELGCVVLFVHHSGKDESKGSRGHSSLKAATDAELSVKRVGDIRSVTAEKIRDGVDDAVLLSFKLESVDLGALHEADPDAGPDERRTSCVVQTIDGPTVPSEVRLSDTDQIALRVLDELLATSQDTTAASSIHPSGLKVVRIDAWRERFRATRGIDANDAKALDASRKALQRAVDKFVKQRLVGVHDNRAWKW